MKKRNSRQPEATPDAPHLPDLASAPLTPSDVLMQACACCGAILPAPLSRLDAIPGQEHLRRAVSHRWFASELLRRLEGGNGNGAGVLPAELLEPLSAREGEVLRFLPTMMSNADIASELFVSVNTVKTHVKSIYRKLDVTRRQDAVRRARQLHIL